MAAVKSKQEKTVEGSIFKAHYIPLTSQDDIRPALMAIKAVAQTSGATHNIWAASIGDYQHYDDDGEFTAGHRLLQTLIRTKQQGVVVVARYYSGHDIGEKRFTAVTELAKLAIDSY